MKSQPSVTTEIISCNGRDWDETERIEVAVIIKTKNKTKAFKGKLYKCVGVNIIE